MKEIKKILTSALAAVTALSMMAGCNTNTQSSSLSSSQSQPVSSSMASSSIPPSSSSAAVSSSSQAESSEVSSQSQAGTPSQSEAPSAAPESSQPEQSSAPAEAEGQKTLVVYFSVPEDVDATGVDAIAGASIVVSNGSVMGNMQFMAQIIQRETGADIYRIESQNPYPLDHQPLIDQANDEQRDNARPAISGQIPDLSGYDVVFLGYPNWWGDMPMILYTFLDQADLSGKTVIPFCVHGGSGFSGTISTIREMEPNANVLDGMTISRNNIAEAEQEIVNWVNGIEIN